MAEDEEKMAGKTAEDLEASSVDESDEKPQKALAKTAAR